MISSSLLISLFTRPKICSTIIKIFTQKHQGGVFMYSRWSLLIGMLALSGSLQAAQTVDGQMIVRLQENVSLQQFEVSVLDVDGAPNVEVLEALVPELNLYLVKVQ